MATVRGDFRLALMAALTTAYAGADPVPFEAGIIEGPQQDRDIGCVWWEGKRSRSSEIVVEDNFYRVRVFKRFVQDQGGEEPRKTMVDHLEEQAEILEAALKEIVKTAGHWYFDVLAVTPDYEEQGVEAEILAPDLNRSAWSG